MTDALLRFDDGPALRNNEVNMIAVSKCVHKYPEALFNLDAVLKCQRDGGCLQMTPLKGKKQFNKENYFMQTIKLTDWLTNNINMRTSESSSNFHLIC